LACLQKLWGTNAGLDLMAERNVQPIRNKQ
jgi:hypothetical protein